MVHDGSEAQLQQSGTDRARVDRVFPLTRGQLDMWLAQQTGCFGAKWQIGMLGRRGIT
jgi:hypothetical protein